MLERLETRGMTLGVMRDNGIEIRHGFKETRIGGWRMCDTVYCNGSIIGQIEMSGITRTDGKRVYSTRSFNNGVSVAGVRIYWMLQRHRIAVKER